MAEVTTVEVGQIKSTGPSWERDGPSSHETCGQFPADEIEGATKPATGAPA